MLQTHVSGCSMSTIRPDRARRTVATVVGALLLSLGLGVGFGASAALAGDPKDDGTPLAGTALRYVEWQCAAAALGAGGTKSAATEVRVPGIASAVGVLSKPTTSSWSRGHTPGRFVALLDATRAGWPVRIRATVELRGNPCRLVAWDHHCDPITPFLERATQGRLAADPQT